MATKMQQRRGTAAEWDAVNPVLASGELGVETDTGILKLGNGVDNWQNLKTPYVRSTGATVMKAAAKTDTPLSLQGVTDHTADLFRILAPDGTILTRFLPNGEIWRGGSKLITEAEADGLAADKLSLTRFAEFRQESYNAMADANRRLWTLEAAAVGGRVMAAGWSGEPFLTGLDNIATKDDSLIVTRAASLPVGKVATRFNPADSSYTLPINQAYTASVLASGIAISLPYGADTIYAQMDGRGINLTKATVRKADGTIVATINSPGTTTNLAFTGPFAPGTYYIGTERTAAQANTTYSSGLSIPSSATVSEDLSTLGSWVTTSPLFEGQAMPTISTAVVYGFTSLRITRAAKTTATLTLKPVALSDVRDAVYLLEQSSRVAAAPTIAYEVSLNGGTTWQAVPTPGVITPINHSGNSLVVRVKFALSTYNAAAATVNWFLVYATKR